ncbi:SprB repeat-containing protein [Chryseobacterium jejuense]|uniref:SprB repeat-containing protein n=1 Tax=Chryseobacterium jejuense TaxID=445960 RepID=UPI001AEA4CF0|nr:SprB repeat-containing protein [Chryseobacterium jejuense]MBP2617879.1 plastocyanin [Chryseobacterium jejuense]
MKKNLFLLLILIYAYSWGQSQVGGTATYRFTVTGYVGFDGSTCGNNITGGLQWIVVQKQDNSHVTLVQGSTNYPNNGNGIYNTGFSGEHDFTKANKIVRVKYGTTHRNSGTFGCKDTDYATNEHNISICDKINYGFWGLNQPGNATETIKPVVTLNPPTGNNVNISGEEFLTITLPDNIDNQYYNWEFSVGDVNNFVPFPAQFNNVPVLHVKGKDFLTDNDFGKTIYIRVNMENCTNSPSTSNIIAFSYYKSAPHILSSTISPVKCFDSTDGSVVLNFDRALASGETLKISLVNTDTGAAVLNQDITNELQNSTSYTLQGLPPGKYKLDMLGTYESNATYTDGANHTISFEIVKPTPVTFSMTSQTNVYCFQGNDGIIALTAGGGQNQFQYKITKDNQPYLDWKNFSNGTNTQIQNLAAGVYKIKVRDSNLCVAKENGNEKEVTITITQPAAAIAISTSETEISQPTGYGLSNGYISVRIIGGTPKADGSYDFEWRKDAANGALITTGITIDAVNNPFTIKLDGLSAGKYYVTVKDKNYSSASSQLGNCGIISQEFIIDQPLPLVSNIEVQKQISCNIANDYQYKADLNGNGTPDEAEDGTLKAVVAGGVGTYTYQWQIQNGGLFQNIAGATQSTLGNLTTGTYKVLVKDANNNMTDAQFTLVFPAELAITLSASTITCNNQSSGQVSVNATGGTGAYSYQWNTNDTTPTVTGLSAGNYFVLVNDSKNCKVSGSTQIIGPDQLLINDLAVTNPICFGAANGEIKINVTGGKAPYNIVWSNGTVGLNNTGIAAGAYNVTVTDANGCSIFRNYTLTDPAQLKVDLGADITLCLGDTQTYNVDINEAGATYQWKDQSGTVISTNASVTLSKAGTYTVLITDSKGCTATDTVVIKNSMDVLNPQLMLTTHAYTESTVVLVNTSPTKPEKVQWIIPDTPDIQVLNKTDEFLELKFFKTGSYEIGLKGFQGECVKTFYKKVVVEENTSGINTTPVKASNVREFTILPNPNKGVFKVLVGLDIAAPIKVRIVDMVSHEAYPAVDMPSSTYFTIPYSTSLPAGTYLIILETRSEALVKRMLVQ